MQAEIFSIKVFVDVGEDTVVHRVRTGLISKLLSVNIFSDGLLFTGKISLDSLGLSVNLFKFWAVFDIYILKNKTAFAF